MLSEAAMAPLDQFLGEEPGARLVLELGGSGEHNRLRSREGE